MKRKICNEHTFFLFFYRLLKSEHNCFFFLYLFTRYSNYFFFLLTYRSLLIILFVFLIYQTFAKLILSIQIAIKSFIPLKRKNYWRINWVKKIILSNLQKWRYLSLNFFQILKILLWRINQKKIKSAYLIHQHFIQNSPN